MQDPKAAASGDLSTAATKSSPPSPSPSTTVNPHPVTLSTSAAVGRENELKGEGGSPAVGVWAGSSEVKGSVTDSDSTANPKRKWEMRETPSGSPRCPECALEFPSWRSVFGHLRAHPDRTYRDGHGIDLNMEATEGETAAKKEVEMESTLTQRERVEETSNAAMESSEGKTTGSPADADRGKRFKVAVDEIKEEVARMEGVEPTFEAKSAQKNETDAASSSANKDERKKVFSFDLNELPPPDDEEDNIVP